MNRKTPAFCPELTPRERHLRDRLVDAHRHLVFMTALRLKSAARPPGWEWEDSMSAGYLGLLKAAERFDPTRGVQFPTFAIDVIRGAILEGMRCFTPGRRRPRCVFSYDQPFEAAKRLLDLLPDKNPGPQAQAEARARTELLAAALAALPERERAVVTAKHYEGKTFKAMAPTFGCSESRVYQLYQQALKRLRAALQDAEEEGLL